MLKFALSVFLFGVGSLYTGWQKAVLAHYSLNCTMIPDPAPYPRDLIRLADGRFSIEGVRELLTCETKPLSMWKSISKRGIILASGADH